MSIFGNILGCCNIYKSYKKSDIEIKKVKTENENLATYILSEKNTQINHNTNNSNLSKNKYLDLNNSKNDEEADKKSATFPKNIQNLSISNDNNININDESKKSQRNLLKLPELKNTVLSLSEIPLLSEIEEKKEENFSKLLLTGDLFFGKELIITDSGMINSKKNKKDGFTIFGLRNTKDIPELNIDFIINFDKPTEEFGNIEALSGKVFEIIFNKKTKEYTLFFINPYLYLYYKINNFIYFFPQRDYFLFVGKIFLSINIEKVGSEQIINIQVDNTAENKEENKEEINKKYKFNQNKNTIKIGRINCDINIPEKCISKIHGIIEFSKINQQFYYKDMNSTNGTTLLIKKDDFIKISGEMNFKLEDVNFKIQEIP